MTQPWASGWVRNESSSATWRRKAAVGGTLRHSKQALLPFPFSDNTNDDPHPSRRPRHATRHHNRPPDGKAASSPIPSSHFDRDSLNNHPHTPNVQVFAFASCGLEVWQSTHALPPFPDRLFRPPRSRNDIMFFILLLLLLPSIVG